MNGETATAFGGTVTGADVPAGDEPAETTADPDRAAADPVPAAASVDDAASDSSDDDDVTGASEAEASGASTDGEGPLPEPRLRAALEAVLLVVDEPVAEETLAQVLGEPVDRVAQALAALSAEYTEAGRGFDLRRAAGGWRLYTRSEYADYVERFVLDGQQARLTQAALETLAVVAYCQPVTRARISAIRGVNSDGVLRTLISRGLVEEAGTQPETGAHLYRTTGLFLEKLGLDSLEELPPLAPLLPEDISPFNPDVPRPDTATGEATRTGTPADAADDADGADAADTADDTDTADIDDSVDTADIADTDDSPDSADSPDSPDSADSLDSADTPDIVDTPDNADSAGAADVADDAGVVGVAGGDTGAAEEGSGDGR